MKEPICEIESRNNALHTLAQVHLEVDDWRGAQAIMPLLFNEKGFAYQDSLVEYVNGKLLDLRDKKLQVGDFNGAEALVDQMIGAASRANSYAALAARAEIKNDPEKISSLARKTEALLGSAKRAKDKFVVEDDLSELAIARKDSAAASRWRQQAIAISAAALQEPDSRQDFGLSRYQLMNTLSRLGYFARAAKEENSLRKIVETTRGFLPKADSYWRSNCLSTLENALCAVASQTHKESDINAVVKFVQGNVKDLRVSDIKTIATSLEDAAAAEKVLNMISDPAERAKALGENLTRKYSKQCDDAIKKADFDSAARAIAQLPDGSDKTYREIILATALAGNGDFATAEKNVSAITDGQTRMNALASIAAQRSDAGNHNAPDEVWQQTRSLLPAVTDPIKRVNLEWNLYGFPPAPSLARDAMPGYFAEVLALPDPRTRIEQLRWVALSANRAGIFSTQRETQAEALMTPAMTKDLVSSLLNAFDLNASECLEQATGSGRESFLQIALNKCADAGNIAAARAIATKMSASSADDVQSALAAVFAEDGDFAEARAAQEKITDKYSRANATRAAVHAFIRAGNLIAAKEYAEHSWPESESHADQIIREMAAAGEVEWASRHVGRLGEIYGPGAQAAVTALQMAKGDLSGAEAAFAGCRYDSDRALLVRAAADSGHMDLAMKWVKSSNGSVNDIVAAQVRAGKMADARALAAQIKRNDQKIGALRAIAIAQTTMGDLNGARTTFQAASKQDKRTPANFDPDPFVSWELVNALCAKPDFAEAVTAAASIVDPYWKDRAFSGVVSAAASKDATATQTSLKSMADPLLRSQSVSSAIDSALKEKHFNDAITYVDLATDEGFRAVGLESLVHYGIDHGDISEVLPHMMTLKDPAARAWLLTDALRGNVFVGAKTNDPNLLSSAAAAVAEMPPNFWQARLYADLARFAVRLDPASVQSLRDKTVAIGQALSGDDAARWQRYIASAKTSVDASGTNPVAKEDKVEKARDNAIDAWTNLLQTNSSLNAPLFTDFKATMDGLANSVPSSADNKAGQLFSNVQQQAQLLNSTLKDVRTLRKKSADDIAAAARSVDK